jgi:hypothetical protein
MTLEDFSKKYVKNTKTINDLTAIPPTPKGDERPKFIVPDKNQILMCDIITMPETKTGFKYILIALDLSTNNLDTAELKSKDAATVALGFKNMMKNTKYLDKKLNYAQLITDQGTEFKGEFEQFLKQHNIIHRTTEKGRHTQTKPIDSRIALISFYMNKAMLSNELENKKVHKEWIIFMNQLVHVLNNKKYLKSHLNPDDIKTFGKIMTTIKATEQHPDVILPIGTKVKYVLDNPIDPITDKKYSIGKFRKGDIRYSKENHVITEYIFNPLEPPMYKLNNIKNKVFIKKQLKVIS